MLEQVLKNSSTGVKLTVKSLISIGLVAAAAFLPLLVHAAAGPSGGAVWLPMYLPVIVGGCVLGAGFGAAVGICSPVASFIISEMLLGSAMPAIARLPFMIAELAVFGLAAGLFSKSIAKKPTLAFPAVFIAQIAGKLFISVVNAAVIFSNGGENYASVWLSVQTALPGLYVQALVVPLIIIGLSKVIKHDAAR